jgi:hypothetical protein
MVKFIKTASKSCKKDGRWMTKNHNNILLITDDLLNANLLPTHGGFLAILFLLYLYETEQKNISTNKTTLINSAPPRLGGVTRRRHSLDCLIRLGAIETQDGLKRSERYCVLSNRAKNVLRRYYEN